VDDGSGQTPSTAHPPAYIGDLMLTTELKQEQVDQMRTSGWGWGEIRIATRLAEEMAANSNGTLTFDDALAQVQAAQAEGKGFGQIAADNNLKVGPLVRNAKAGTSGKGAATKLGDKAPTGTPEEDGSETPSTAHPPTYIGDLMKTTELKQEQVDQMRTSGWGWGEIRLATKLAQQMAANSNGTLTFDDALAQVQAARAEGKGFGQIAAENNLKIGPLVRNKDAAKGGKAQAGPAANQKKPGLLTRIGRFLGFGRSADKPDKASAAANVEKPHASAKAMQLDRPERPERPERPPKAEKPDRPERLSRPEKPEKGPHKG
jgi:hypothetical protein